MEENENEISSIKEEESFDVSFFNEKATLLATLYAKALDSQSPRSLLHDHIAWEAVKKINYDFKKLHLGKKQGMGIVIRAHLFDQWTDLFIEKHKPALVLQLGCGLDTRVYRVNPGDHVQWVDIDYPDVIEIRQQLYPSKENYSMIGSSVTKWDWMDHIPTTKPTLIIAEGLFMYLDKEEVKSLIQKMLSRFSNGQLVFDAISSLIIKLEKLNPVLRNTNAALKWGLDNVHEFESWHEKLKMTKTFSVSDFAKMYKERFSVPNKIILRLLGELPVINKLGRILQFKF